MKCVFCNHQIDEKKGEFFCKNCKSMYRYLEENNERTLYFAYPDKKLRKNFMMKSIYIPK